MKKALILVSIMTIGLFSSCVSNPGGGNSDRYQVIPALRNGVVLLVDKDTWETFRMKLDKEGNTTWSSLGSPADAK